MSNCFFPPIDAVIGFSQTTYSAAEGGTAVLLIVLNAASVQPISVQLNTMDDSAVGTLYSILGFERSPNI